MQLKPDDVVRAPPGHVIEVHGTGTFALVRPLDAAKRPPIRLRERSAQFEARERELWPVREAALFGNGKGPRS